MVNVTLFLLKSNHQISPSSEESKINTELIVKESCLINVNSVTSLFYFNLPLSSVLIYIEKNFTREVL